MTPRKDDIANLAGAYSLDAVTPAEREAFEAHLAESQDIRNEVTELTDTAVLLGMATDPVQPAASIKASIMAQIAATPQFAAPAAAQPVPVEAAPDATPFSPAEAKAHARWFARPLTALAAAAAAVLLIVGGGVVAGNIAYNNQVQQAQAAQFAAINAASDSHRIAAPVQGGGNATLVWSPQLASSAVILDGVSTLPDNKVYELWYIDSAGPRSAGTFTVGSSGSTWQVLTGSMGAGDTVGITVEPSGGSKTPTTPPIVAIASA